MATVSGRWAVRAVRLGLGKDARGFWWCVPVAGGMGPLLVVPPLPVVRPLPVVLLRSRFVAAVCPRGGGVSPLPVVCPLLVVCPRCWWCVPVAIPGRLCGF